MANTPNIVERGSDGVAFEKPIPASQPGDTFPAGVILDYAGAAAPTGWLICDGSVVSRATYPQLFANIGTTYGAGDGSTTFGIPDARGRGTVGKHTSGTFQTLGLTGGEENHTLTVNEMPSHSHGGITGTNSVDHQHGQGGAGFATWSASLQFTSNAGGSFAPTGVQSATGNESVHHSHAISAQGGGAAANNMAPYIVFNKIIRAY